MSDEIATYLSDVVEQLHSHKKLGEKAIAQVYDSGLTRQLDAGSNSIATLVKHMSGNMRSRWTGFLTSDGEKPERDRDAEFEVDPSTTRAMILEWWDDGWGRLFDALKGLRRDDLSRTVMIRGTPITVIRAINLQLAHYAYHVGQIVQLAKHFAGPEWKSLSIPKRATGAARAGKSKPKVEAE
jgi:hypothetical protein